MLSADGLVGQLLARINGGGTTVRLRCSHSRRPFGLVAPHRLAGQQPGLGNLQHRHPGSDPEYKDLTGLPISNCSVARLSLALFRRCRGTSRHVVCSDATGRDQPSDPVARSVSTPWLPFAVQSDPVGPHASCVGGVGLSHRRHH